MSGYHQTIETIFIEKLSDGCVYNNILSKKACKMILWKEEPQGIQFTMYFYKPFIGQLE